MPRLAVARDHAAEIEPEVTDWNQMAAEAAWVIAIIALMAFIVAAIALAATLNISVLSSRRWSSKGSSSRSNKDKLAGSRRRRSRIFVDVDSDQQFQLKVINASDYPNLESLPSCSHVPRMQLLSR